MNYQPYDSPKSSTYPICVVFSVKGKCEECLMFCYTMNTNIVVNQIKSTLFLQFKEIFSTDFLIIKGFLKMSFNLVYLYYICYCHCAHTHSYYQSMIKIANNVPKHIGLHTFKYTHTHTVNYTPCKKQQNCHLRSQKEHVCLNAAGVNSSKEGSELV